MQQLTDLIESTYDQAEVLRRVMPPQVRELWEEVKALEPEEEEYAMLEPDEEDFEAIVPGWYARYGLVPCQVFYSAQLRKWFRLKGPPERRSDAGMSAS